MTGLAGDCGRICRLITGVFWVLGPMVAERYIANLKDLLDLLMAARRFDDRLDSAN